jgi:AcrR family transcriptional regulator
VEAEVRGERRYRSPLREERAADTRRRIATAALDLFSEGGFGETTVAAIAERAGVSAQTVYAAFGSKGAILRALLAQMEEDADAALWRERIAGEPDPRLKLTAFAQWSAGLFASSKAVIAAAQGAASDPAMLEVRELANGHRRAALDALAGTLEESGALRAGLSRGLAVDRAWILTAVEPYLAATDGCGWSDQAYAEWLADLLISQLLAPGDESGRTRQLPDTKA